MRLKSYILNNSFAVKGFLRYISQMQKIKMKLGRTKNKFRQLQMRSDNSGQHRTFPKCGRASKCWNSKNSPGCVQFKMAASRGLCLGQALLRRAVVQRPQAAQVLLGIRRGKCLSYTFFKIVTLEQLQR